MIDFTTIDFETANGFRGSACSIGMVKIRDGKVADTYYQLLKPPVGYDRFDPRNVKIHRLLPSDVADAPRFGEAMPEILDFIGSDIVFAHNARFDIGVIESGMEVSQRPVPQLRYGCSLVLARKIYQLPSHALPHAAAHAGFTLDDHHNALADAEACAAIVTDIARTVEADTIEDMLSAAGMQVRELAARPAVRDLDEGVTAGISRATTHARSLGPVFDSRFSAEVQELPDLMSWPDEGVNPVPDTTGDPGHPLFGQHVVFTGNLGMPRQEAKYRAAAYGAQTANRVNGTTTMLIVGDGVRPTDLTETPQHPVYSHRKMRDVVERNDKGQNIWIVTESEFLQMLDTVWPEKSTV